MLNILIHIHIILYISQKFLNKTNDLGNKPAAVEGVGLVDAAEVDGLLDGLGAELAQPLRHPLVSGAGAGAGAGEAAGAQQRVGLDVAGELLHGVEQPHRRYVDGPPRRVAVRRPREVLEEEPAQVAERQQVHRRRRHVEHLHPLRNLPSQIAIVNRLTTNRN